MSTQNATELKQLRIMLPTGKDSEWTATNPVILNGELIIVDGATTGDPRRAKLGDGVTHYVDLPFFVAGGASGNLQAVTDIGNSTTNSMVIKGNYLEIQSPSNAYKSYLTDYNLQLAFPSTHYSVVLQTRPLTANRTISLPNNTGTLALLSDIAASGDLQAVTDIGNVTTNAIISGTLTDNVTVGNTELSVNAGSAPVAFIGYNSGDNNGYVILVDGASNNGIHVKPTTALAANRVQTLPDKDGVFAMISDITASGDLQAVLDAGNTATSQSIHLEEAGLELFLNKQNVLIQDGTRVYAGIQTDADDGILILSSAAGAPNVQIFRPAALTADREVTTPDASGEMMLTKDFDKMLSVDNISTHNIIIQDGANISIGGSSSGVNSIKIEREQITFHESTSGAFVTTLAQQAITASNTLLLPKDSGTLNISATIDVATDANKTVAWNTDVVLPAITANRTLTLGFTSKNNDRLRFVNNNSSGNAWNLSAWSYVKKDGSAGTAIANGTSVFVIYHATTNKWYEF